MFMHKHYKAAASSFALLLTVLLCGCELGYDFWPRKTFTSSQWKNSREGDRYVFAHDLVDHKLLIGKSKEEVLTMLGEPSSQPSGSDYATYIVKADSGVLHLLHIQFELQAPNKVQSVLLRED